MEDFAVLDERKETLFLAEKDEFPKLTRKVEVVRPEKQTLSSLVASLPKR